MTKKQEQLLNEIRAEFGTFNVDNASDVITSVDSRWFVNGRAMSPLSLFAVVKKHGGGDWEWLDFSTGRWSGVVSQHCVTQSEGFALRLAKVYRASVERYSLVRMQ